ncbi:hypothetical protein BSZ39_01275 [Bowdeniella nasicola]|uniref:Polyketide cyclase / dehydrase and lipid transport n=1 Tax=Bowdeniella nasicola TaxID=208480 RepID=A0A1Q5Q548_9ACTO|nr:SRPBCC domain-containing protein [Bowdeniella nasicola]OKL54936.1 hypothetical protein BSZ39_01275 [Bowdeniella nasicola]
MLRELLVEPSGLIQAILQRLGVTPDAIRVRLAEVEYVAPRETAEFDSAIVSRSVDAFIPAPLTKVWQLLSDPTRMAEWEPGIGSVDDVPESVRKGSSWTAYAPLNHPDGKPLRIAPERQKIRVEVTRCEEPYLLEWRYSWPEMPSSNERAIRITIAPAAGGTQLVIAGAWIRNTAVSRRRASWLLRPVHRYMTWVQLSNLAASISRVFQ